MHIPQQLDQLSRKLRQIQQQHDEQMISAAKLAALQIIKAHNPVTLKELAALQKVALPTMSKIVDELQKRSLVIRALSKNDARKRWIVPTQKGIKSLNDAEKVVDQYWQQKLGKLTDKQRQQLSSSLELLIQSI